MTIINVDDGNPPPGPRRTTGNATEALQRFGDAAASSGVHPAYLAALRDGHPHRRYRIPIGDTVVSIAVTTRSPGHPPYDTRREVASWQELRRVVADVNAGGDTTVLHPGLPHEVAVAVWPHAGRYRYVARPGTPAAAIRGARPRTRWHAITSTPLAAALTHKLSHATVTATTAASLMVPIPPITPPATVTAPIQAEDLGSGSDHYQRALPAAFAAPSTPLPSPMLPEPAHDTGRDTTPDLTPEPSPAIPAAGIESPAPTPATSPDPAVPPVDNPDDDAPADDPVPTTPAPSPTSTEPSPTSSTTPPTDRRHRPGRHRGHHHKHGHDRPHGR